MKRFGLMILSLAAVTALPAQADDIMVPAAMQRCTSDADCTMVANSCGDTCADLPVNKANLAAIDALRAQRCGSATPTSDTQTCTTNPPLESSCINNRCTIGYAYQSHGDAGDYQPGAYPVPESPVPSQTVDDYSHVNDRDGNFSAYDLPDDVVRQNVMGQYKIQAPAADAAATSAPTAVTP